MGEALVVSDPEGIELYSLLAMKHRLKLEMLGLKFRGRTTYSIIKERFLFKGNKASVLEQLQMLIDKKKEARDKKYGDNTAIEQQFKEAT